MGVHKNAKICLYCIRHGNPLFLGNFLWFFTCGAKRHFYQKCGFPKFRKNHIFIKMMKTDVPWNFTIAANYDFSKNVILLTFVKYHFLKGVRLNTFWNSIMLTYFFIIEQVILCVHCMELLHCITTKFVVRCIVLYYFCLQGYVTSIYFSRIYVINVHMIFIKICFIEYLQN